METNYWKLKQLEVKDKTVYNAKKERTISRRITGIVPRTQTTT